MRQLRAFNVWRHRLGTIGDGCTGVPDFDFKECCDEHDEMYQTHRDPATSFPITKEVADDAMYWCIYNKQPPAQWRRLIAWLYWWYLSWSSIAEAAWDNYGEIPPPPEIPPP